MGKLDPKDKENIWEDYYVRYARDTAHDDMTDGQRVDDAWKRWTKAERKRAEIRRRKSRR